MSRRWPIGEGEEARLTPAGAEVRSRGFLPLRSRSEASHHARPAFPGTAVVLGERLFEVLSESAGHGPGRVVYRLRPWPDGEVVRDRVVYDRHLVRRAEAERERIRQRERVRPFAWLLYPLVGLLPEDEQDRACDRLGLYSVTATLVSGLAEGFGVLCLIRWVMRRSEMGLSVALLLALPALVTLALPGFGRALGAAFLRETGGSGPVVSAFELWRTLRRRRGRRDAGFVPLTRAAFWERLERPDLVEASNGGLRCSGLLAHLSWTGSHRLQAGAGFWTVTPLPPEWDRGRLVYTYRLDPADPAQGSTAGEAPGALAYADEVLGGVRIEWDWFNHAFSWLTSLLAAEIQARAFGHRGGPAAARRPTLATAAASALFGLYLLSFLPGAAAADPLAPVVAVLAGVLVLDAILRFAALRQGRYAPSLFRFLLPSHTLPPERIAYRAHRDAERDALERLSQR